MSWFSDFLNVEYDRRFPKKSHGSLRDFAKICKKGETTVGRWLNDEHSPGIQTVMDVIEKLGGDLNRALPSYKQSEPKGAKIAKEQTVVYGDEDFTPPVQGKSVIWISGQVQAGQLSMYGEDAKSVEIDTLWKNSRYHGLTHGPISYVEVVGDSMAPDYMSGEVVACRAPSTEDLPNGTPCFMGEGDGDVEGTFKLFMKSTNGMIIGQPINPAFDCVLFPEGVSVPLIVMGKIHLERGKWREAILDVPKRKKKGKPNV